MFRQFRTLFAASLLFSALVSGCAPEALPLDEEGADDSESELALSFSVIDAKKKDAPEGLTIITKTSDYVAFFGSPPPSSVNFKKHWVLHYSLGIKPSGGFGTAFTSIERLGTGNKVLTVTTLDTTPGPLCAVTQALSNPQVAVIIPKQKSSIGLDQHNEHVTTDCSEPNFCATALCAPGWSCDELLDGCVMEAFCPKVKCANGYSCDEDVDACVPNACDPAVADSCPPWMVCDNQIQCITFPCPEDFRCEPAPVDPCQGIDWVGTCDGAVLKYCDAGQLVVVDCAPAACGFAPGPGYYDCQ